MHLSKVYNENNSSLSHNLSKLVEQTKIKQRIATLYWTRQEQIVCDRLRCKMCSRAAEGTTEDKDSVAPIVDSGGNIPREQRKSN